MRDFLLTESIKRLATEAATRFSTLVAMGEEIPFDVAADRGDDSAFYSYVPMTGRYVAEHAEELRALPRSQPTSKRPTAQVRALSGSGRASSAVPNPLSSAASTSLKR